MRTDQQSRRRQSSRGGPDARGADCDGGQRVGAGDQAGLIFDSPHRTRAVPLFMLQYDPADDRNADIGAWLLSSQDCLMSRPFPLCVSQLP